MSKDDRRAGLFRAEVIAARRGHEREGSPLRVVTEPNARKGIRAGLRSLAGLASLPRVRRRNTRPLRYFPQLEANDCGVACLATVLDFHGYTADRAAIY